MSTPFILPAKDELELASIAWKCLQAANNTINNPEVLQLHVPTVGNCVVACHIVRTDKDVISIPSELIATWIKEVDDDILVLLVRQLKSSPKASVYWSLSITRCLVQNLAAVRIVQRAKSPLKLTINHFSKIKSSNELETFFCDTVTHWKLFPTTTIAIRLYDFLNASLDLRKLPDCEPPRRVVSAIERLENTGPDRKPIALKLRELRLDPGLYGKDNPWSPANDWMVLGNQSHNYFGEKFAERELENAIKAYCAFQDGKPFSMPPCNWNAITVWRSILHLLPRSIEMLNIVLFDKKYNATLDNKVTALIILSALAFHDDVKINNGARWLIGNCQHFLEKTTGTEEGFRFMHEIAMALVQTGHHIHGNYLCDLIKKNAQYEQVWLSNYWGSDSRMYNALRTISTNPKQHHTHTKNVIECILDTIQFPHVESVGYATEKPTPLISPTPQCLIGPTRQSKEANFIAARDFIYNSDNKDRESKRHQPYHEAVNASSSRITDSKHPPPKPIDDQIQSIAGVDHDRNVACSDLPNDNQLQGNVSLPNTATALNTQASVIDDEVHIEVLPLIGNTVVCGSEAEKLRGKETFDIIVNEIMHCVTIYRGDKDDPYTVRIGKIPKMRAGMLWLVLTRVGNQVDRPTMLKFFRGPHIRIGNTANYPYYFTDLVGKKLRDVILTSGGVGSYYVNTDGWSYCWIRRSKAHGDSELLSDLAPFEYTKG